MILPGVPLCNPLRNIWEQTSYFIEPLFLLIVHCHGCYTEHAIRNIFERISITHPNSEGHPVDVILIVYVTTDHL